MAALVVGTAQASPPSAAPLHQKAEPTHTAALPPGASTTTVTLLTGDSVTLQSVAGGHLAIRTTAAPRKNGQPVSIAVSSGNTTGKDVVTATPSDAAQLVSSGKLDRGLFDVSYLASLPSSRRGALTLAVQFPREASASALRAAASHLTGATVVSTVAAQHEAVVQVPASKARAFWASATTNGRGMSVALSQGIAHIWLAGHRLGNATGYHANPADSHTVTETIATRDHSQQICQPEMFICTYGTWQYLYGLTGAAAGQQINPTGSSCDDPCRTLQLTFTVPDGTYSAHNLVFFKLRGRQQWAEADQPEFTVSGDTSLAFDLNDAQHIDVSVPDTTETYNAILKTYRSLPDGTHLSWMLDSSWGYNSYWAVPSGSATTGDYHLKTSWVLAQPLVSASVTSPKTVALHAMYPGYRPGELTRFKGTTTLQVVAAGDGRASDYNGIDATGKLVLLHAPRNACLVRRYQLQQARLAGAAGVVIDSGSPFGLGHNCLMPLMPYWFWTGGHHVQIPFIEIPKSDGASIRSMLATGPVSVTITDNGATPYEYDTVYLMQNQIPSSTQETLGLDDLAAFKQRNVATTAEVFNHWYADYLPDEDSATETEYDFRGPTIHQVYVGPLSSDLVYLREGDESDLAGDELSGDSKYDVFNKASYPTESWGTLPAVPGDPLRSTAAFSAQPGKFVPFAMCSACRQGNVFLPWAYVAVADPQQANQTTLYGLDPSSVHLYSGGDELKQTPNDLGASEYTLPDAKASYRLTMASPNAATEWTFTSAAPKKDKTPKDYICPGTVYLGLTDPCTAPSLVFLRYDAHVSLHNELTASATHTMTITGYHQADKAPAITSMSVETSVDGGTTWVPATLTPQGKGRYVATYDIPDRSQTDGSLSIRVNATDASGSTVTQTLTDAIGLIAG